MRIAVLFFALAALTAAFKPKNPLKTKKYKCVEVAEDEEVRVVSKYQRPSYEQAPSPPIRAGSSEESIELPTAHRVSIQKVIASTVPPTPPPDYPSEVKRDKEGRPLILSPEHCKQMKTYASRYGVVDVLPWVKKNCTFAKMFLPNATCDEIYTLVQSCYRNKFL